MNTVCMITLLASTTFGGDYDELNNTRSLMYFNPQNIIVLHPSSYDPQITVVETTKETYYSNLTLSAIHALPCQ
jgi:hypothetical protein